MAANPQEPFDQYGIGDLLSDEGRRLWLRRIGSNQLFESTPTLSDAAARAGEDRVARQPWVEGLAQRIRSLRRANPQSPLFIHVHGPWGSGKTSILNMLADELSKPVATPGVENKGFQTAQFNAWQYQRIEPPWWSLVDAILDQVGLYLKLRHSLFKIWSLRAATIIASLAVAIVAGFVLLWWVFRSPPSREPAPPLRHRPPPLRHRPRRSPWLR